MPRKKDVRPTSTEFQDLKDYLKSQGFKQADLDTLLGVTVSNRTRDSLAQTLRQHLKTLTKKKP